MIFLIIRLSTNIVLRVVCRLHLYEAQRLFSVYHVSRDCFQSITFFRGIPAT